MARTIVTFLAAAGLAGALAAVPPTADARPAAASPVASASSPAKVVGFLEALRMAVAALTGADQEATPLPTPDEDSQPSGDSQDIQSEQGPEEVVDGQAPQLGDAARPATVDAALSDGQTQNGPWTGTGPNPNNQVGRLFFDTDPGPAEKWSLCSGTVVNTENRSLVVTAGHCVYNPDPDENSIVDGNGYWYENFQFCPGYDGNCELGLWKYKRVATTDSWFYGTGSNHAYDYRDDMAVLVMEPNEQGNIADVVGGQGIRFNDSTGLERYALGYPAPDSRWPQYDYDGNQLVYCDSTDAYDATVPGTLEIACTMTGGASGGPWLTYLDDSGLGYVNSVNSHKPHGGDTMNGPYFDEPERALFNEYRAA